MDIAAIAAFITPFVPFLLEPEKDAAKTTAETAASKFGEASWQKAQTIWAALSPQVKEQDSLRVAIADIANNLEDPDYQASLRVQLKKRLASDPDLAKKLADILRSGRSDELPTYQANQVVTGNHNQTIGQVSGGQVFGSGNFSGMFTGAVATSGADSSINVAPAQPQTDPASEADPAGSVKTILVLAANPKNTAQLRLTEEVREIQAGLERSKYRDRFRIEQRWAVTSKDIRRALLNCNPQIVHFSGHGVGIAELDAPLTASRDIGLISEKATEPEGLLIEDETGHSHLVSTDAIAHLFSLFSDEIECVVLNACYSAAQAEAIAQHIPYVVGMKKAIGDRAAIEFSIGFYDALLAGRSVEFAHRLGCNSIQMQGIPEHLTPVIKKK